MPCITFVALAVAICAPLAPAIPSLSGSSAAAPQPEGEVTLHPADAADPIGAFALQPVGSTAPMSPAAERVVGWIAASRDNENAPFMLIDKRQARLWLFDARAGLIASSAILLGAARGDHTVPGIGERPLEKVAPWERTTPAGRFVIEPGRNLRGEDIFWVDYEAAVSMHRVRATQAAERRLQRLATPSPADNRISWGCINVPVAFFEQVIQPAFAGRRGIVYILPEQDAPQKVFASLAARADLTRSDSAPLP